MRRIHPTAFTSTRAIFGEDVEIGPHAVLHEGVTLGDRCVVQAHAVITGHTTLGDDNFVGYGAVIGSDPQDFSFQPGTCSEVRIGNGNVFREYVTIHLGAKEGTATCVGDKNYLMTGVHLGHNACVHDRTVIANNVLLGGYTEVEDEACLGGGAIFHQNIRVGRNAMIRGGARLSKDVPPYTTADDTNILVGLNAIGLKRAGFSSAIRLEIKRAFALLYLSGYNVSQALEVASAQQWGAAATYFFDFVRAANKHGICRCRATDAIFNECRDGDSGDEKE